jgi:circadian clock protein KaiC
MRRGLTVLKMRGSMHDQDIRKFTIDGRGLHVGRPFRKVTGTLSGNFTQAAPGELGRMDELVLDAPGEGTPLGR